MHKLVEYICDEMEQLERKAEKDGKLSMQEIQYADTLAHLKKNILKADEMWEESEYSNDSGSYARGRGRNARRDSMGRYANRGSYDSYEGGMSNRGGSYERGYSRAEDFRTELQELMRMAPNDHIKQKMQNLMSEM